MAHTHTIVGVPTRLLEGSHALGQCQSAISKHMTATRVIVSCLQVQKTINAQQEGALLRFAKQRPSIRQGGFR